MNPIEKAKARIRTVFPRGSIRIHSEHAEGAMGGISNSIGVSLGNNYYEGPTLEAIVEVIVSEYNNGASDGAVAEVITATEGAA